MRAKESQSAAAVVEEDVCENHLNEAENKVTIWSPMKGPRSSSGSV